jgi:hypothetical protein
LQELIKAQNALIANSSSGKVSVPDLIASVGAVYTACVDIKVPGSAISSEQKKAFFSLVEPWLPWANKALAANAGGLSAGDKAGLEGLIGLVSKERLFYSNLTSVLSMYEDYAGARPLSQAQAELFASFLTKMAGKPVVNYFQCRLIVEGMMELVSGGSPDSWNFTFPNNDAQDFVENVLKKGLPPGFKAESIQSTRNSVSFSIAPADATEEKISEFVASSSEEPGKAQPASKRKVQEDGAVRMARFSKISFTGESKSDGYTPDRQAALDAASDQPSSYMARTLEHKVSSAVYYGERHESDKFRSKVIAEKQVEELFFDLAKSFGYTTPPATLNEWLVSKGPGKGQEFLQKLKDAKITLDVTGSADMAVYFDGKNKAEWTAAADKNLALAQQRSGLVINRLEEINALIAKADPGNIGFAFSSTSNGRLHFFQDGLPSEAASKYGYKQGDGAANMSALMSYLRMVKGTDSFKVGETTINFTDSDRKAAAAFYDKLLKSGAVVQGGQGYKAGDAGLLNKYFRRMTGDPSLNGAQGAAEGMIYEGKVAKSERDSYILPNIFSRAMTESTEVSSRSVSLVYKATAYLGITADVAKEGDKDVVKASAEYRINNVPVLFNDRNGTIELETVGDRTIAKASAKDNAITSGYVWKTVPVEAPVPQKTTIIPPARDIPLPKMPRTTFSPVSPSYTGTAELFLPFTLGQSSNTAISNALNKAYLSLGATYDLGVGVWKLPSLVGQSQYNAFVDTLTASLAQDPNFSSWCPNGNAQQLVNAFMHQDRNALKGMLTEAAYNSLGDLLEGKSQKVRIENASALAGAQLVGEVTVNKVFALTRAKSLGVEFTEKLAGGANPFKLKGLPDLSSMQDGDQKVFKVDGKKYLAVCRKQEGGDAVGIWRTPMDISLVLGVNNKSLMVYDKVLNATSANATVVGSIRLKNAEISPYIGAGISMPTNKSILKGAGQDFYLNYPVMVGASSRFGFSQTLKAGLDFGIQHILSKEASPFKVGQITVSLEKKIPKAALTLDVHMGQHFFESASPSYFAGAGLEIGKRFPFTVGAEWEVADPLKNIQKGIPRIYLRFSLFPKGTE